MKNFLLIAFIASLMQTPDITFAMEGTSKEELDAMDNNNDESRELDLFDQEEIDEMDEQLRLYDIIQCNVCQELFDKSSCGRCNTPCFHSICGECVDPNADTSICQACFQPLQIMVCDICQKNCHPESTKHKPAQVICEHRFGLTCIGRWYWKNTDPSLLCPLGCETDN